MTVNNPIHNIIGWNEWLEQHSFIRSRIAGATTNSAHYFLQIHGASEAAFRRILLVGFRLNYVTYKNSQEWLHHHDKTPSQYISNGGFIYLFDKLYENKNMTWSRLTSCNDDMNIMWDLWNNYSKIIRNHISHSIRNYTDDWLTPAIAIDQKLIIELDREITQIIGGSPFSELNNLNPRLPIGVSTNDPYQIMGTKRRSPRPAISLKKTQEQLKVIGCEFSS